METNEKKAPLGEFRLTIPDEVKKQLKESIVRFNMFLTVIDLMKKNNVETGDLEQKVNHFREAGEEMLAELDKFV